MEILKFEEINPVTYKLRIRIKAEALVKEFEKVLGEMGRNAEIPGFRRGNAPHNLVERHIGSDEIWRLARDSTSYDAFNDALKREKKSVLGEPRFEHEDYLGHGDYEFEVTFHTEPPSPQELVKRAMEPEGRMIRPEDHLPDGFLNAPAINAPDSPDVEMSHQFGHPDVGGQSITPDITEAKPEEPYATGSFEAYKTPVDDPSKLPGSPRLHPRLPTMPGEIIKAPFKPPVDDQNISPKIKERRRDPEEEIPERFKKPTKRDNDDDEGGNRA